jgi:hypothetical protein
LGEYYVKIASIVDISRYYVVIKFCSHFKIIVGSKFKLHRSLETILLNQEEFGAQYGKVSYHIDIYIYMYRNIFNFFMRRKKIMTWYKGESNKNPT